MHVDPVVLLSATTVIESGLTCNKDPHLFLFSNFHVFHVGMWFWAEIIQIKP